MVGERKTVCGGKCKKDVRWAPQGDPESPVLHLICEETEAGRGSVTCPRRPSCQAQDPGLEISWFTVHFQDHVLSQEEREERRKENSKEGME